MGAAKDRSPARHSSMPGTMPLFTPDSTLGRSEFLTLARGYFDILKIGLNHLRTDGTRGLAIVSAYSHSVDALVGLLFQRALQESDVANGNVADIAIFGMGGYGRAELAPLSDVDILILCKRKTQTAKRVAASFVQLMWDTGFELGHSVESIIQSERALAKDMDTRTALFESRWICGSKKIANEAAQQIKRMRRKDREAFLRRKIRDAVARHRRFDNRYQLIEPNIKLSPGGMRDYQTLVWLGSVVEGDGLSVLKRKGLLLPGEKRALEAAYEFLVRARIELHVTTASKQDQLTVAMQKKVAEALAYRDRGGHLAVELFMRDYYNHTRIVSQITSDIIEEMDYGKNVAVLLGKRRASRASDKLRPRIDRAKLREHPLYIFEKQKAAAKALDRSVKRRLEALLAEDLQGSQERKLMRKAFVGMLRRGSITLTLRSMHETGFLGVIIPEYNELTSLKRYDLYHHYTVDEHSFQVVQNIEALASSGARRNDPLARLYSEIADKEVLYLTALLHDIGKIEGRGHARKGAVLARRILKRMNVKPEVIDQVCYLIEIHLLMSHYSQRRDPGDPGTLRSFVDKVKTRSNLKYLCLLTYADMRATSPLVWTEWKRNLLWALYMRAHEFMAQKEKKPDEAYERRKRSIVAAFPAEQREHVLEHLDMLPGRYLLTMKPAQVRKHLNMIDELGKSAFVVRHKPGKHSTEITFCTWDKPFRLSQLCAVLTLSDCNILHAYAFTRSDGKVIDVFQVEDISGTRAIDDARIESLAADLQRVLSGKINIQTAIPKHLEKWKRRRVSAIPVKVTVDFDNDTSSDVTIIDIQAADQPGLLFAITRALSEEKLIIHRARISTEANKALDSFDVQGKDGEKLTSAARLRGIRQRIDDLLPG